MGNEIEIKIGAEVVRIGSSSLASIMEAAVSQLDREIDNPEAKEGDAYIALCRERRDIADGLVDKLIRYRMHSRG